MNTLFLLVLAHIFADFPLQTDGIVQEKSRLYWLGHVKHLLIVYLTSVAFLLPYLSRELVLTLLVYALVHMGIDIIKNCFSPQENTGLLAFLLDQAVHFCSLYVYWGLMDFSLNRQVQHFISLLLFPKAVEIWRLFFANVSSEQVLLTLIVYSLVVYGGAVFTKKVLNLPLFDLQSSRGGTGSDGERKSVFEIKRVGYYLGMLERALIITFTALNSLSAVAFIFTAKSIARFSELNQKDFAEYYLTGTLLSVLLGIMGGMALRYMLGCMV